MSFFRSRSIISFDYSIRNECLPRVEQMDDLVFKLGPYLSFNYQIEFITFKALHNLGFIRRNASNFDQENCLKMLYTSLVRSTLEYRSIIWSLCTQIVFQKIERVQKHFLSYASHVLKIIHLPHDYTPVSKFFNLTNLDIRKNMLDVNFNINLVHVKTDATRSFDRISFRVPRLGF